LLFYQIKLILLDCSNIDLHNMHQYKILALHF
jgi:hypothetical protein